MRVSVFSRTSPYWQLSPEKSLKWKLKGLLKACFLEKLQETLKHKKTVLWSMYYVLTNYVLTV